MTKLPGKLNVWIGILVGFFVLSVGLINAAIAVDGHYAKQSDLAQLSTFTKMSFAELDLERTLEKILSIRAVPERERERWQIEELLRLEDVKEKQERRLEIQR